MDPVERETLLVELKARGLLGPRPFRCKKCDKRNLDMLSVDPVWGEIRSQKVAEQQRTRPSVHVEQDSASETLTFECHDDCGARVQVREDRLLREFARSALAGESKIYWPPKLPSKLRIAGRL